MSDTLQGYSSGANLDNFLPRVGAMQLQQFVGRKVLFVGKLESFMPGTGAQLVGPDGGRVMVHAQVPIEGAFVEVEARVVDPQTLHADAVKPFNDKFDMHLYNEFLKLANDQHVAMFRQ